MSLNRVVITGRGAVSPYGVGMENLSAGIRQGRSGVKIMEAWREIGGLHSFLAAPVPEINPKEYLPRSVRRTMGNMALHAAIAAREAADDAGLTPEQLEGGRTGVVIGSTTGSPEIYESFYSKFLPERSAEGVKSGFFFKIMSHSCAANVSLALGINGEQWAPASACTSAAQSMGLAYLLVKSGRQDSVLCGGADEVHHTVTMVFDVLKAASRDHGGSITTPRPFDRDRDGVVCGGGSGILVLENFESALKRNAKIYCEVLGFGHVTDSSHIANPHEDSMARAMKQALDESGVKPAEIDYINAHATGTLQGDTAEAIAIGKVVGNSPPVSSFKGHIGHTLGAAGALETLILLEMMEKQEVFPTLNLENPDPDCGGINLARNTITGHKIDTVLKNNFALGGVNAALVLRRCV